MIEGVLVRVSGVFSGSSFATGWCFRPFSVVWCGALSARCSLQRGLPSNRGTEELETEAVLQCLRPAVALLRVSDSPLEIRSCSSAKLPEYLLMHPLATVCKHFSPCFWWHERLCRVSLGGLGFAIYMYVRLVTGVEGATSAEDPRSEACC